MEHALALVHAVMRDRLGVVIGGTVDVAEYGDRLLCIHRTSFRSFYVSEQRNSQGHEAGEHAELAVPRPPLHGGTAQGPHVHDQMDLLLLYLSSTGTVRRGP